MIFGKAEIVGGMLETHNDHYTLSCLKVISTRRPTMIPAILFAIAMMGFVLAFFDLLYASEIIAIITLISLALLVGLQLGQLRLLSRELSGNELSGAVWGTVSDLRKVRSKIAAKLDQQRKGDSE